METLQWGPDLETGIAVIDAQHKRLVQLVNQMYEARQKHDMNTVGAVIPEMVDYSVSHFNFEEELMQDAGYGLLKVHKWLHEQFVNKLPDFQARYQAGEDITEELYIMLSRWLTHHICREDRGYVQSITAYLAQNGEVSAPGGQHSFWKRLKSSTLATLFPDTPHT